MLLGNYLIGLKILTSFYSRLINYELKMNYGTKEKLLKMDRYYYTKVVIFHQDPPQINVKVR